MGLIVIFEANESTFLSLEVMLINLGNIKIFSLKLLEMLRSKPWAAGFGSKFANPCAMLTPFPY